MAEGVEVDRANRSQLDDRCHGDRDEAATGRSIDAVLFKAERAAKHVEGPRSYSEGSCAMGWQEMPDDQPGSEKERDETEGAHRQSGHSFVTHVHLHRTSTRIRPDEYVAFGVVNGHKPGESRR